MSDEAALKATRDKIDQLDREIQLLINQRAEAAQEVARIKLASNPAAVFYRPEREASVLHEVKARNTGPVSDDEMARLFREIMSCCLALEQPLKIAFLGPEGTFSQTAALKHFGHAVTTLPVNSIPDIFAEVTSGSCHYGVVPVENSTEGVVSHTLDTFMNSPLKICGEVDLRINHHLLSNCDQLEKIERVFSHQQSLAQCRGWLDRHLLHAKRVPVGSNAEAARLAAQEQGSAAIAGETAAEIYGLTTLSANIEDESDNTTRFVVISKSDAGPSGHDKTSLLLSSKNESGGLHALLAPLAINGISMTRIESRPSRQGIWEYVFFIDIDGHRDDDKVASALNSLSDKASLFKVLGSYPRAII